MNPIVPSLTAKKGADGGDGELDKMSSSSGSKIDPLEPSKKVAQKINKAFCEQGNVDLNGPLTFCRFVVFPAFLDGKEFVVKRDGQSDLVFTEFKDLKNAFREGAIHPKELKQATFEALDVVLAKVRKDFASEEMKVLKKNAYPSKEDLAQQKAAEVTPEKQWILDFLAEKGELPAIKDVRTGLGISKRDAKRAINEVKKTMK